MNDTTPLDIAVVGAGPVGLALALHAARTLPAARVSLFDARPLERDVSADARTLALSLGSVQLLQRLDCWPAAAAQPIAEVHVSQQPPSGLPWLGPEPELRIRARDEAVPMLGAVLAYGELVSALQQAWLAAARAEPARLRTRFGTPVAGLKDVGRSDGADLGRTPDGNVGAPKAGPGVEVDAGVAERFDLAVVAEGGVFAEQARKGLAHDYRQTAWVGNVGLRAAVPGVARGASAGIAPGGANAGIAPGGASAGIAFERFTRHGPAALLPLRSGRAALVWCVRSDDDPVRELNDVQRAAVLESLFHRAVGGITDVSPLKAFPLGLNAETTLVRRRVVRIGNAAQTLHPVAGQGLNLGLRDAFALVFALRDAAGIDSALRRVEWSRAADRWSMIAATDFLARSFTWTLPGLAAARGLGLAALQRLGPARSLLARQMMFGTRQGLLGP